MDQLEKTQKSNGVVQDDPETILRLSEKIDVLFSKIKVSPAATAQVYGEVLSRIIRDLIPAKDVLTKVIKEMIIPQPHVQIVAEVLHQVRVLFLFFPKGTRFNSINPLSGVSFFDRRRLSPSATRLAGVFPAELPATAGGEGDLVPFCDFRLCFAECSSFESVSPHRVL